MGEVYLEGSVGLSDARLSDEQRRGLDYRQIELSLGYSFLTRDSLLSPSVEAGYGFLSGNDLTFGSHRDQVFLKGSGRLNLLGLFFLEAKLGVGMNSHTFSTIAVLPYPTTVDVSFIANLQGGVTLFPHEVPYVDLFVGGLFEQTLHGQPYRVGGIFSGIALHVDLGSNLQETHEIPHDLSLSPSTLEPVVSRKDYDALVTQRDHLMDILALRQMRSCIGPIEVEGEKHAAPPEEKVIPPKKKRPETQTRAIEESLKDPMQTTVIHFAEGSDRLTSTFDVQRIVDYLKEHLEIVVIIHGHASSTGKSERNQDLALNRARNLKKYLLKHGISPAQILQIWGHSDARPLNEERPQDGYNRAVLFETRTRS